MVKVKPVQLGKTERMSFSRIDEVIDMPNLIEVQTVSYTHLDVYKRQVRERTEEIERITLSPFATLSENSRGRACLLYTSRCV